MKGYVDEAMQGIGKYADKDEVMKKLMLIDRQIKKLLEMRVNVQTVG